MFPGMCHRENDLFHYICEEKGKKERRRQIHREDKTTEDTLYIRAGLIVFDE